MKTGTSSLMDGKDYQQRKVMRIDDINAMADVDIRENERLEKLAEEQSKILGWGEYQGLSEQNGFKDAYINGYNKAKETLYTEKQVTEAMLQVCEYLIDAMKGRYLIDTKQQAKIIIKSLKQK